VPLTRYEAQMSQPGGDR